MHLKKDEKQGVVVIAIDGEVNITTSPDLRNMFLDLLNKNTKNVVVDFKAVSYIDSSGLATLIEMVQHLKKDEGALALANMEEKIRDVFVLTKIDKLFPIYDSEDAAVASLTSVS